MSSQRRSQFVTRDLIISIFLLCLLRTENNITIDDFLLNLSKSSHKYWFVLTLEIQVEQSKGNPFFVLLKQTNAFAYTYAMPVKNHKLHKHAIIYNTKILKQWTENSVTFCFFKCSICMPCFGKLCPNDIFLEKNNFYVLSKFNLRNPNCYTCKYKYCCNAVT